jgi:hypothetical protein
MTGDNPLAISSKNKLPKMANVEHLMTKDCPKIRMSKKFAALLCHLIIRAFFRHSDFVILSRALARIFICNSNLNCAQRHRDLSPQSCGDSPVAREELAAGLRETPGPLCNSLTSN